MSSSPDLDRILERMRKAEHVHFWASVSLYVASFAVCVALLAAFLTGCGGVPFTQEGVFADPDGGGFGLVDPTDAGAADVLQTSPTDSAVAMNEDAGKNDPSTDSGVNLLDQWSPPPPDDAGADTSPPPVEACAPVAHESPNLATGNFLYWTDCAPLGAPSEDLAACLAYAAALNLPASECASMYFPPPSLEGACAPSVESEDGGTAAICYAPNNQCSGQCWTSTGSVYTCACKSGGNWQ